MPDDRDDLDDFVAEQRRDPQFAAAHDDAHARADLLAALVHSRKSAGLSQTEVADTMGTTQSAVSDLESGSTDPRLGTLQRYAHAVGARLIVSTKPIKR